MNQKGFVLMETIVVIFVLCVILVMLYASYSNLLISVQNKSLYDNTEYIYKTQLVREYLEEKNEEYIDEVNIVCNNDDTSNQCSDDLYEFLKIQAIYITPWNTGDINDTIANSMEPTTQKYYKYLDPKDIPGAYRIIVMYESENGADGYEYASLKFGSR